MTPKEKAIALAAAVAIAIPMEGYRRTVYLDPKSILTVCFGTTGPDVIPGKVYDMQECRKFLERDMLQAIDYVDKCAPGLPTPVVAAFADAVYNIGPKIACDTKNSTAARKLKAGDIAGACRELPRWNKIAIGGHYIALEGLTKRRAKEQALCLSAV